MIESREVWDKNLQQFKTYEDGLREKLKISGFDFKLASHNDKICGVRFTNSSESKYRQYIYYNEKDNRMHFTMSTNDIVSDLSVSEGLECVAEMQRSIGVCSLIERYLQVYDEEND